METTVSVVAIAAMISWGLFALWKRGIANFWRLLVEANERHGTRFGTSPKDQKTLVGVDTITGGVLAFDQENRKIAYITKAGKSIEILDYRFVQAWKVVWQETTRAGGVQVGLVTAGSSNTTRTKVFLEITTNDLDRPIIRMPMSSVPFAQDTAARLGIMINQRN